ncbi:MAG: hypothetical protein GXY60_11040 [Spirochaetales bacterium]|nr:hypothetical protein [Spirochaetales bacterium]
MKPNRSQRVRVIVKAIVLFCIVLLGVSLASCRFKPGETTLYIANESGYHLDIYADTVYLGEVLYPNFNVFSLFLGSHAKEVTVKAVRPDEEIVVELTRTLVPSEPYHWYIYGVDNSDFF